MEMVSKAIQDFVRQVIYSADSQPDDVEYHYSQLYRVLRMFFKDHKNVIEMMSQYGDDKLIGKLDDNPTTDSIDHHHIPIALVLNDSTILSIDHEIFHTGCCLLDKDDTNFKFWLSLVLKQTHHYIRTPGELESITPGIIFYNRGVRNAWIYEKTGVEVTSTDNMDINVRTYAYEDVDKLQIISTINSLYMNQRTFYYENTPGYIFEQFQNILKNPDQLKPFMLV